MKAVVSRTTLARTFTFCRLRCRRSVGPGLFGGQFVAAVVQVYNLRPPSAFASPSTLTGSPLHSVSARKVRSIQAKLKFKMTTYYDASFGNKNFWKLACKRELAR